MTLEKSEVTELKDKIKSIDICLERVNKKLPEIYKDLEDFKTGYTVLSSRIEFGKSSDTKELSRIISAIDITSHTISNIESRKKMLEDLRYYTESLLEISNILDC